MEVDFVVRQLLQNCDSDLLGTKTMVFHAQLYPYDFSATRINQNNTFYRMILLTIFNKRPFLGKGKILLNCSFTIIRLKKGIKTIGSSNGIKLTSIPLCIYFLIIRSKANL